MLENLLRLSSRLMCYVDRLCTPNPKYSANRVEQDVEKSRNKMVLALHVLCITVYIFEFLGGAPLFDFLFKSALCLGVILALFLSCRYHPQIFRCLYTLICTTFGPSMLDSGPTGIHAAWAMIPVLPVFLYMFTGSFWHAALQAIIQLILLDTLYFGKMMECASTTDPESFTLALRSSTLLLFLIFGIVIYLIQNFLKQAYQRAWNSENRKNEVENQKVFLMSFSHELRNLINSLTGNVKLVSLERNLSENAKELLVNAEVCGELLVHLVNNILDTGKVEIGELEINPTPTRIYDSLERIWNICSEIIRRKDLRGKMTIVGGLPRTVMTDSYRLTQVFLNLVGNAVKFTDEGHIKICVEWLADSSEVSEKSFQPYPFNADDQDEGLFEKGLDFNLLTNSNVRLSLNNRKINHNLVRPHTGTERGVLKVTITDSGSGMSTEAAKKLFQKFTQISQDPSKRKLGTGLGLFITRQICTGLQGEIRVFSKENKGSCFAFCIPMSVVQMRQEAQVDKESLKATIKSKGLRAMIVDDASFNHAILLNYFDKLGIKVTDTAINGLDAYEKYANGIRTGQRHHIVAMDIDMPVMDGKEASRLIRELERKEGLIPSFIGIVSGNCSNSEISECLNKDGSIQANHFLKKPASLDELLKVIADHFIIE